MELTLIAAKFVDSGGVPRAAYELYNGLKSKITIKKLSILDNKAMQLIKAPGFLKLEAFFLFNLLKIKNKNIHVFEPDLLPIRYLTFPHRKIVTVHDLYALNSEYVYSDLYKKAGNYKKSIKNYLARINLAHSRKIYENIDKYDHIITLSEITKDKIITLFDINKNKISVIPNIIGEKFHPLKTKKNEKMVIGYINGYSPTKREKLLLFIQEFKKVKDSDLELHLYGEGFPFRNYIKDDPRIKYFGFLPEKDIVKTTNGFDVYLSTSLIEGFGLPIMQAKACKIPVLCYDGELPSICRNNTVIWNDNNLHQILKNRPWIRTNLQKAYKDAEDCRANNVITKVLEVYDKTFNA